jgi:hypothetical protein
VTAIERFVAAAAVAEEDEESVQARALQAEANALYTAQVHRPASASARAPHA